MLYNVAICSSRVLNSVIQEAVSHHNSIFLSMINQHQDSNKHYG